MSIISVNEFGDQDGGGGPLLFVIDHDPFSVATDAPLGSFLIGVDGVWYRKLDDGSTTNVEAVVGGGGPALGSIWRFSTTTTDADPGAGTFRLNNATQGSATFIYINDTSRSGLDASNILMALRAGDRVYIQDEGDASRFHLFSVTGDPTDATTYVKIPVSAEDTGADLINNRECGIIATFSGGAALTHAPTHINGGSDEIDGDQLDIDFTPSNYVPTTSPPEVSDVDHLTAHLAGIDDALLSTGDRFSGVDTAGGTDITAGWTDIPLNVEHVKSGITHSASSAEIAIVTDGDYMISGQATCDQASGTQRTQGQLKLQIDTGGGYGDVAGTIRSMYSRQASAPENTAAFTIILSLSAGDTLKLQAQVAAGAGTLLLLADGSGMTVMPATVGATVNNQAPEVRLFADQFDIPDGDADYTVTDGAPVVSDSNNAAIAVAVFDDTTEEGVAFPISIPDLATGFNIRTIARAEVGPGVAAVVSLKLYAREFSDNTAPGSWNSVSLSDVDIPTNENFQYDTSAVTLASLSLTAGDVAQFELTRDAGNVNDDLVSDWALLQVEIEWTYA